MAELANRPVLDSDVLIDYLRGAGPGAELVAALRSDLAYCTTAITAFELALGRSTSTIRARSRRCWALRCCH